MHSLCRCALVTAVFILASCKLGSRPVPPPPPPPAQGDAAADALFDEAGADQNQIAQIAHYRRGCLRQATGSLSRSRQRYLRWCDAERGPGVGDQHVYGVFEVSDRSLETCREAVEEAGELSGMDVELHRSAIHLQAKLSAAATIVNQAHTYYRQEDYRDDDFARGRALHVPLMEAFRSYAQAYNGFMARMREVEKGIDERTLARLEQSPDQRTALAVERVRSSARRVLEHVNSLRIGEDGHYTGVDAANFASSVEELEAEVTKLETEARLDDRAEGVDGRPFLAKAKQLMRALRDGDRQSANIPAHAGPRHGSPADTRRDFGTLRNQLNRARDRLAVP